MKYKFMMLIVLPIIVLILTHVYFIFEIEYRFVERIMVPTVIDITKFNYDLTSKEVEIHNFIITNYYNSQDGTNYLLNNLHAKKDYRELAEWFVEKKYYYDWPIVIFNIFIIIQLIFLIITLYIYSKYLWTKYWFIEVPFVFIYSSYTIIFWFIGLMHISGSGI